MNPPYRFDGGGGAGGAALMDCCVLGSILLFVIAALIIAAWWKGDNYYQPPKNKHPILVGRLVEFTLEGEKLIRGKVTSQQEDKLGVTWMNRRGEIKHTYRTIAKVSLVD